MADNSDYFSQIKREFEEAEAKRKEKQFTKMTFGDIGYKSPRGWKKLAEEAAFILYDIIGEAESHLDDETIEKAEELISTVNAK